MKGERPAMKGGWRVMIVALVFSFHLLPFISPTAHGQKSRVDWDKEEALMADGSYKSAFSFAEKVYNQRKAGSEDLLAAVWYMARAGAQFEEESSSVNVKRLRNALPRLEAPERAVAYMLLGVYDSVLMDDSILIATPVERISRYTTPQLLSINYKLSTYDVLAFDVADRLHGHGKNDKAVALMHRLADLHQADSDIDIYIDLKLIQIQVLPDEYIFGCIDKYRASRSPMRAKLYYLVAERYNERQAYVDAVRYCDSALALNPAHAESRRLRNDICATWVELDNDEANTVVTPEESSLHRMVFRNVKQLHFYVFNLEGTARKMLQHPGKPLKEWTQALPDDGQHRYQPVYYAVPPLPMGRYLLVASPDGKVDAKQAYIELMCTDLMVNQTSPAVFQLLDRRSGDPVVGQEVVWRAGSRQQAAGSGRAITDADGRVRFDSIPRQWFTLEIVRGGVTFSYSASMLHTYGDDIDEKKIQTKQVTDRPIYRPGDTVRVAGLFYRVGATDGATVAQLHASAYLSVDEEKVGKTAVVSNDLGAFHFEVPIPADIKGGGYGLMIECPDGTVLESLWVRVEAYKQPKFTVTLDADRGETGHVEPAFGQPIVVRGQATAYHGAAIAGARVKWMVKVGGWQRVTGIWESIASGETTTVADGSFTFSFIPQPDTNTDAFKHSNNQTIFSVSAEVTDLSGETQSAETRFTVGLSNRRLRLEEPLESQLRELSEVVFSLTDLDGRPVKGNVDFRFERLVRPDTLRLEHPVMTSYNTTQLISYSEFRRMFPQYAYAYRETNCENWATDWTLERTYHTDGLTASHTLELPEMPSGVYRMVAHSGTVTDTQYVVLTRPTERSVESGELFWTDVDRDTAAVGSMVTLRYASAFKDVRLFYTLVGPDGKERDSRWLPAQKSIRRFAIPVDSTMVRGFSIFIIAVKEGCRHMWMQRVDVPIPDKLLTVEINTFRDKLEPGEEEEWVIRAGSREQVAGSAALMLAMYDAALDSYDSFGSTMWQLNPWHGSSYRIFNWKYDFHPSNSYLEESGKWNEEISEEEIGEEVSDSPFRCRINTDDFLFEDEVEEMMIFTIAETNGVMDAGDEADRVLQRKAARGVPMAAVDAAPQVELRTNLNTLAFFAPALRTDSAGVVTYRFRVPDLLTRWSIRGLAFTPDLKIGTIDRSLVTQKRLMVQPNIPRFLREGDSVSLMAKVMNLTDDKRDIKVTLVIQGGENDTVVRQSKRMVVSAQGAEQAIFAFEVPHAHSALTYSIIATTDDGNRHRLPRLSDGERGEMPVLSDREVVTLSKALYINGVGEKTFAVDPWPSEAQSLTVQLVANPMELALEAIPHIGETENPSTLYLANRLYVNTLAATIKQTLEVDSVDAELASLREQLFERQNADGGWSWMPDGQSSPWVTQQILKLLAPIGLVNNQALDYVDSEMQKQYENLSPHTSHLSPHEVDYLYMRSFYGKASTEAYKFFYSSAKNHYKECEHLYTQAQLALAFQRMGDRRKARDIVRRLKEKSLESDEMGVYWRDNRGSWCWYERPIETQALLIKAFSSVTPKDETTIALMQQWLLKQKQTTHWGNDRATVEAIDALLTDSHTNALTQSRNNALSLTLFDTTITAEQCPFVMEGAALDSLLTPHSSLLTLKKQTPGIAWGAVFCQYEDDIEEIPLSESGITVTRTILPATGHKVGDRVKVRIEFTCDRTLDYLELVDKRPSCLEPVSTRSGWHWNAGASYYLSVDNTANRCYFERVEKGSYVIEFEYYVTNPGNFLTGTLTLQSMYAPEFRATAPAQHIEVRP